MDDAEAKEAFFQPRSADAHRDVITAITDGDADLAESAMRSHILAARHAARRVVGDDAVS